MPIEPRADRSHSRPFLVAQIYPMGSIHGDDESRAGCGGEEPVPDLDTSTALDTVSDNSLSTLLLLKLSENSVFTG